MRIIEKSRNLLRGTHKGYEIEIERERRQHPHLDDLGLFYIRVWSIETGSHAYDGYSPAGVTTMAEAKREALYGSQLKARPAAERMGPST